MPSGRPTAMERAQPISGLPCSGPAHSSPRTSNIRSAVRCSAGIYIESGSEGAAKVAVDGNAVDKYGSAGVVCNGESTACTVTGNTLRGRGRRIGVRDALQSALGLIEARADYNALTPETRDVHAAYIASWLKVLKDDKRVIVTAASHAQKAADYLFGLQPHTGTAPAEPMQEAA